MIAIKGHQTRGEDVIKTLISLGDFNRAKLLGNGVNNYYYIDSTLHNTIYCHETFNGIKKYTLEEFEDLFPFRVGDIVDHPEYNTPFKVVEFNPEDFYPYTIEGVCKLKTKSNILTKHKENMSTLNKFVRVSLEKAKEWYNKGGDLKEIALQAFEEKDLNPFPKTWEDYINKKEYNCKILDNLKSVKNLPYKYEAILKLEYLRNHYRQGWYPCWSNDEVAHVITRNLDNTIIVTTSKHISVFLSFKSKEIAELFYNNFKELIIQAGDLI